MEIFYVLLVLLLVTRAFGEAAVRLGQPALVGELISGIALGMLVRSSSEWFPVLSDVTEDKVFTSLTDLGVFFLMLLGGMEMRPADLAQASRRSLLVAGCGLGVPLVCGLALGWMFLPDSDIKLAQSLFVGIALAITAVPVAIRVLLDLGQLRSRIGQTVVSAAVFDDVLSLVLLAILTALINTGGLPDATGMLLLVGRTAAFFLIAVLVGRYLLPRLGRLVKSLQSDEFELTFLLLVALALSVLAEFLHLHFILGAFLAGLFFVRQTIDAKAFRDVEKKVAGITTGFLAPVFFASIGLHLDPAAITSVPGFLVLLVVVAIASKLLGAGLAAYAIGLSRREASAVGIAMSARGAVELIIADIALRAGLFNQPDPPPPVVASMFSAIVIMAVVTTLVVPILLRRLVVPDKKEAGG